MPSLVLFDNYKLSTMNGVDAVDLDTDTGAAIPRRSSSQAVSREPCSTGRVSSTHTLGARPRSAAARTIPRAVP